MKKPLDKKKDVQYQAYLERRCLYFRYGRDDPDPNNLPEPILPVPVIASLLGIQKMQPYYIIKRYIKRGKEEGRQSIDAPTFFARPGKRAKVTNWSITAEEFEFITSTETLRNWAPYSMQQRCVMFHRQFPNRQIRPQIMRKIMY